MLHLISVGSIGIDTIETPTDRRENILGGSATYACAAASFFTGVGLVGVVGDDFPGAFTDLYERFGVRLEGLQRVPGKTFRWSGVYEADMNVRRTLLTELNVFAEFSPELPPDYRDVPFVFLANIAPSLQLHVLDQVQRPRFVAADTMDLWIQTARDDLEKVMDRVDLLTLNESEARLLTDDPNLVRAGLKLLERGLTYVLIKKGEHGSILFYDGGIFIMPAYPLSRVTDPTGAGDSFAGGVMGWLAASGEVTHENLRTAMLYGSVVASFGVEDFSLDRLAALDRGAIDERARLFHDMLRVEANGRTPVF